MLAWFQLFDVFEMSSIFVAIRQVVKQVLDREDILGSQIVGAFRADTFNELNRSLKIDESLASDSWGLKMAGRRHGESRVNRGIGSTIDHFKAWDSPQLFFLHRAGRPNRP